MDSKRILVIDDDETVIGPIKDYLEHSGLQVAVAFDGMQGVLQAHAARPDLILLDFNMPAGGGATVYERLRNANDTCRIPIIFTTGVALEEVKGRIRPSPHTYFLKKPVSLTQIGMVLNQVLGLTVAAPPPRKSEPPPPELPPPPPSREPAPPPPAPAAEAAAAAAPAPKRAAKQETPPRHHEFQVRVAYADTDKMGVIYYANYFKYFEVGRTELLRSLGVRYRDLELERKLYLPIVETRCSYLGPSRYDDLLIVRTWLSWMGPASVCFQYEIYDRDSADRLVARGFSRHAVVNERWRPTKVPGDLRALLTPFVRTGA